MKFISILERRERKEKKNKLTFAIISSGIMILLLLLILFSDRSNRNNGGISTLLLIRIPHNHHRAHTVPHAVITNASKPAIITLSSSPKPTAPHNHSAQPKPLDLQAKPLLHIMIFHNVYLKRNLGVHERLGQIRGLGGGKCIEIILQLLLRLLVLRVHDGEVNGTPIGTVENRSRTDVDENDGVPRAEVVVNGPLDGEGGLVGEVDGDANLALGAGGGSVSGGRGGGGREAGGGGADFDFSEGREVGIRRGGVVILVLVWVLHRRGKGLGF